MLIEEWNSQAAYDALMEPAYDTRVCVSVKPDGAILRFVRDAGEITAGPYSFGPVPYARIGAITSGAGSVADTTQITLDGSAMTEAGIPDPDSVLQSILNYTLRDRPIQIGLIVLNVDTKEPIGLIPKFVGFVDSSGLDRDKKTGPKMVIELASYRGFARRRVQRTYSYTDHITRFAGDHALKWLSDAVFRGAQYPWNKQTAVTTTPIIPRYRYGPL